MNAKIQNKSDLPVFLKLFLALIASLVLFAALSVMLLMGLEVAYANRIYPGVSMQGVDLSGLTEEKAYHQLSESLEYTYEGKIELTYQDQVWEFRPIDLGYLIDPTASAQEAFAMGRGRWFGANLFDKGRAWFNGAPLSPVAFYDERIAQRAIADIAAEVDVPLVEASLALEGAEVIVRDGQVGRQVNLDATLAALAVPLTEMQSASIPLVVTESSPVILDASAQAQLAQEILSEPLVLTAPAGSGSWTILPEDLAEMLMISRVENEADGAIAYEIALNETQFNLYLSSLAPGQYLNPVNTRFIFNDDSGQLDVLEPAVIGRALNLEASLLQINDRLAAGDHEIALQFDTLVPAVTDEMTGDELGVTELVHQETSYFYGSDPSRVQNIGTAAARFHGLLIPPGATFSMAQALGNISLENGYAEALIIYGDQTIQGVGGGVCQVSTTLFRAAFFAGYPIVERHAHAYRVSYYEMERDGSKNPNLAGLDATVYVPIVDLKFTNDTEHWLLMETYTGQYFSLTWKFYSTSDGRTVDWNTTGPTNTVPAPEPLYRENADLDKGEIKKVDYAAEGADISVNRTVYRDGTVYFSDAFYTHFQAWRAVFEYGPGTEDIPD